jgi:hypothetical protein
MAAKAISTPRLQRSKLFADVAGTLERGKRGRGERSRGCNRDRK